MDGKWSKKRQGQREKASDGGQKTKGWPEREDPMIKWMDGKEKETKGWAEASRFGWMSSKSKRVTVAQGPVLDGWMESPKCQHGAAGGGPN